MISIAELKEGFLLLCVMVSILLMYAVGLMFTRRADRNDVTKVLLHGSIYTTSRLNIYFKKGFIEKSPC